MEAVKRGRGRPRKYAPQEQVHYFNPISTAAEDIGADVRGSFPAPSGPTAPSISTAAEDIGANVRGSFPAPPGPTAPLPDKSLLVLLLDKIQKKDNYGLFAEPVDPNVVPDYHQIIKNPMDFRTLRKKLDDGDYTKLEELEADVMLICSNAMTYNAADTIYYKMARTIQGMAKRDFDNLRNEGRVARRGRPPGSSNKRPADVSSGEDKQSGHNGDEPQPNLVARRGRPPSNKNVMENPSTENSPADNGYNLRKTSPVLYNFLSNDGTRFGSLNDEDYSSDQWNSDFPASILREDMKYGKKNVAEMDKGRRDTYKPFQPSSSVSSRQQPSDERLIPVHLHADPQAYGRSLMRFAKDLGPVAWNVACKKLKTAYPDGSFSSGRA